MFFLIGIRKNKFARSVTTCHILVAMFISVLGKILVCHSHRRQGCDSVVSAVVSSHSSGCVTFLQGSDWRIKWRSEGDFHFCVLRSLKLAIISVILPPWGKILDLIPCLGASIRGVWGKFQRFPFCFLYYNNSAQEAKDPSRGLLQLHACYFQLYT